MLEPFAEYWECDNGFGVGRPEAEAGLPGATASTGSILFYGEDGYPYRFDPVAGAVEAAFGDEAAGYYDLDHAWSPDGTRVAYTTTTAESADPSLVVAAADGTGSEVLVESAMSPRWSPDGNRLAYQDADPFARRPGIWIIDLETHERVQVAEDASLPAWSPDGTRLAYTSATPLSSVGELGPSEIHVVNIDGSDDRALGPTIPFTLPAAWSPDGSKLAFAATGEGDGFDVLAESSIAIVDLDTGEQTTGAVEGATLAEPAWSPDGSRVAFALIKATLLAGTASVGLVDAAGGEVTEIARGEGSFISTPTWSPDGDWIVVTSQGGPGDFRSTLVAVDVASDRASVVLVTDVLSVIAWRTAS